MQGSRRLTDGTEVADISCDAPVGRSDDILNNARPGVHRLPLNR